MLALLQVVLRLSVVIVIGDCCMLYSCYLIVVMIVYVLHLPPIKFSQLYSPLIC